LKAAKIGNEALALASPNLNGNQCPAPNPALDKQPSIQFLIDLSLIFYFS
jgi:hypothetical protein